MSLGPINVYPNSGLNYQNYSQNYNPYSQHLENKMTDIRSDFTEHQQRIENRLLDASVQPIDEPEDFTKANPLGGLFSLLTGGGGGGGSPTFGGGFTPGGGGQGHDWGATFDNAYNTGLESGWWGPDSSSDMAHIDDYIDG